MTPSSRELEYHLGERLIFWKEFLAVTEALKNCLTDQHLKAAEKLLERREELIHAIRDVDGQIQEVCSRGEQVSQTGRLQEIGEVVHKTCQLNEVCVDRMAAWRETVRDEISRMREALRTLRTYRTTSPARPKFLDIIE